VAVCYATLLALLLFAALLLLLHHIRVELRHGDLLLVILFGSSRSSSNAVVQS
jgi:hypothetical protein